MSVRFPLRVRHLALGVTLAATAAHADVHNSFAIHALVNGNNLEQTGGLSNDGAGLTRTLALGGATLDIAVNANQFVSARSSLSGSGTGYAKVQANSTFSFKLQPPAAGGNVKGGKVVLHVVLEGTATGNADIHLVTAVSSDFGKGTGSAVIADAGTRRQEFDVEVPVAPFIDDISIASSDVRMHLDVTSNIAGSSGSSAEATSGTRVTGFRVFDATGAQVAGFVMVASGGNIPELAAVGPTPPATGTKVTAVEFYHAAFRHYFISANPAEIAKLDNGTFAGWARTGQSFNVYAGAAAGMAPVCRFFTVAFPPTSSHFYAPRGLGCEGTLTNDKWTYEGEVFHVPLPVAAGTCPAATIPVYRLYNNGQGGAPNHRFTTSDGTRQLMLAQGFVAEGAGVGIGFCSPQ